MELATGELVEMLFIWLLAWFGKQIGGITNAYPRPLNDSSIVNRK